jgi:hypothetical protein
VVKNAETDEVEYIDHEVVGEVDHEFERTRLLIEDCETLEELQALAAGLDGELKEIWDGKHDQLSNTKKK